MNITMKRYAIIVAGGSGTRFGGNTPKQFLPLNGTPVLMHTIRKFASCTDAVVVVLPQREQSYWAKLCVQHHFSVVHHVVSGGNSRFESVKNGLQSLSLQPLDLVAVHDGVRPMVSEALIARTFAMAEQCGAAIPAIAVTDSVRQLGKMQTPQTFRADALLRAYDVAYAPFFTDDASVYEHAGGTVALVEGEPGNIKITHPIDIVVAEHLMKLQ